MASLSQKKQRSAEILFLVPAVLLAMGAGAVPVFWSDPVAPLFVIGMVFAAAVALYLVQRPLLALCITLFLILLPIGLRLDVAYDVAMNLSLVVALVAFLLDASYSDREIRWNAVCILIVVYMAWGCVTLFWSPDLISSRQKLVAYTIGLILVFLMSNQIRSVRAIDAVMRVLGAIGWILVIGGIQAMLFGGPKPSGRLVILDLNQNLFGMILVLMLPGVIWPVLRSSGSRRTIYMALSVVFILCSLMLVAMTGSRGSALSLLVVLFGFWFWKPMRPWGIVGVALIAGLLLVAPFLLETLLYRFEMQEGGELGGRDLLWQASYLLIRDYPWTGTGIGNGPPGLNWYISSLTSESFSSRRDLPSHNPMLEAGVETGVIGLFIYVSICASALFQFIWARKRAIMHRGPLAAYFPLLLGTTAGYVIAWFKGGGVEVHSTFFILLGLLLIPSQLSFDAENRPGRPAA